jgi:hypothetical protein
MVGDQRYHRSMSSDMPPGAFHPDPGQKWGPSRPAASAAEPPAQPQWVPTPAPGQPRRWLPLAIVTAAILLAAAIVAAAIILSGVMRNNTGTHSSTASPSPTAAVSAALASTTCNAWRATKPALDAIPALPDGWDWNTPNIDTYIANRNAAITRALDLFEAKITAEPTDVSAAAHEYVSAKHSEMQKLSDHSYTASDGVPGNTALATLNQLCGLE